MKNMFIFNLVSKALLVSVAATSISIAQCDERKLDEYCKGALVDGFTFIKSFNIMGDKTNNGKMEFSYIFSKDTHYLISLCGQQEKGGNEVGIALYDGSRQLIFNSADKNGESSNKVIFKCKTTGVHYIMFTYLNEKMSCHQAQIGFKRH